MEKVLPVLSNCKSIHSICKDALNNQKVIGIIGSQGLGKTTSLLAFKQQNEVNVNFVRVYKSMTTRIFCDSVLRSYSKEFLSPSLQLKSIMKRLIEIINKTGEKKLLIIDEAGKLTPKMIEYLTKIRESTKQNIGIVLADVEYFKNNIERWKKSGRSEIIEFDKKINYWHELSSPSDDDIQVIINSNSK